MITRRVRVGSVEIVSPSTGGVPVWSARVFFEGGLWRWEIVTLYGTRYVDGANHLTKLQAQRGLLWALDPAPEKAS